MKKDYYYLSMKEIFFFFFLFLKTFMAFKVQYDASAKVYQSLRQRIKSKEAFQLTLANLTELEDKWNLVQRRTHLWQLKLDRSLPGELCNLGEWLYNAEEFLERRLDISDDAEKMIQKTQALITQHEVSCALFDVKRGKKKERFLL